MPRAGLSHPTATTRQRIVEQLDSRFPTHNDRLDRELAELLTALEAPGVIPRTLRLLEEAGTQEQQIHFAMCLRDLPRGWTLSDQKRYLGWFARAGGQRGGITFGEYMGQIRGDAVSHLSASARHELADLLRERPAEEPYAELKRRRLRPEVDGERAVAGRCSQRGVGRSRAGPRGLRGGPLLPLPSVRGGGGHGRAGPDRCGAEVQHARLARSRDRAEPDHLGPVSCLPDRTEGRPRADGEDQGPERQHPGADGRPSGRRQLAHGRA